MARLYSSIHIKSNDDTFLWVSKYLIDKGYISKGSSQNLRARVKRGGYWWENVDMTRDDRKIPDLEYSTGGGIHSFTYKGRKLWVQHVMGKTLLTGWNK
jgi:hypothetical protein